MTAPTVNPELGSRIVAAGIDTNYHDVGKGFPLIMIHGSGPGVTAWANWRLNIPVLSKAARVIAPDMVGFGYTTIPHGLSIGVAAWIGQLLGLMDALKVEQADIVGNSFGGGLALAFAIRHPQRVRRLILMGSVGLSFPLTAGLDAVWGYTPSIENMKQLLRVFAYDQALVNDGLAEMRYKASIRPGVQESFSTLFSPGPRQRFIDALASREEDLARLPHKTLVVHGRDDQVIPLANSERLAQLIPDAQLHVYPRCGHWTQIEWAPAFNELVGEFIR